MKNIVIPEYPLYGYDNSEEMDRDVEYMKSIYPKAIRRLLKEVEEECDKLEYDGSCMLAEIPDTISLGKIVDNIYDRCLSLESEFAPLEAENIRPPFPCGPGRPCPPPPPPPPRPCHGRNCPPPPPPPPRPCPYGGPCRPYPDYGPNNYPDWMRNSISSILFNEMIHRRRRHRSRKRWS